MKQAFQFTMLALAAVMITSACALPQQKKKDCIDWEKFDYSCPDDEAQSPKLNGKKAPAFGACDGNDLANFTCH